MPYLLDTCAVLWALDDPESLGAEARRILETEPEVYVSAVSAWEIQVKYSIGKLSLVSSPREWWAEQLEKKAFRHLALEASAVFLLGGLPVPHKDPFDRMLVCQALYHGLVLLTPDPLIKMYPVNIVW